MTFKNAITDKTTVTLGLFMLVVGVLMGCIGTAYAIGSERGVATEKIATMDEFMQQQGKLNQTITTAIGVLAERTGAQGKDLATQGTVIESIRQNISTINQRIARLEGRGD